MDPPTTILPQLGAALHPGAAPSHPRRNNKRTTAHAIQSGSMTLGDAAKLVRKKNADDVIAFSITLYIAGNGFVAYKNTGICSTGIIE